MLFRSKEEKVKAAEMAKEEEQKREESQQRMYDNISGLVKINPRLAEDYLQTLKKHDII